MASLDLSQRRRFIESLELPAAADRGLESLAAPEPPLRGDTHAGFVNDGSLVSFVANVTPAHRQMALRSTLLAQLAATRLHDRESETEAWYKQYRRVLEHCGWVLQDFSFERYDASGTTFTVEQAILGILGAIATQNQLAIIQQTLKALKNLADGDRRLMLWDRASRTQNTGNFQVGLATDEGGALAFKIAAFRFKARQTDTKFLWFTFGKTDADLYTASQAATLDEEVFAGVSSLIAAKLGERTGTFIGDLQI